MFNSLIVLKKNYISLKYCKTYEQYVLKNKILVNIKKLKLNGSLKRKSLYLTKRNGIINSIILKMSNICLKSINIIS